MEAAVASEVDLAPLFKAVAGVGNALEPLARSWADPERFYAALLALRKAAPVPPKSALDQGVDLYHDLIAPHLRQGREALVFRTATGWRRLGFDELHALSGRLAGAWEKLGAAPGKKVAIVLPVGPEYAVALLTALRLGMVVSVLPPLGAAFLARRLTALAPDHVASHPRYTPLLGEHARAPLPILPPDDAPAIPPTRSYTYEPDEPAAQLFSALSPTPYLPIERTAAALFRGVLRDALVTIGLQAGDRFALPGFDPVQFQPSALLASLFAGACFIELDEAALADEELLQQAAPRVLGVTAKVRDQLLARAEPPPLRLWLRNLAEPFDWDRWSRFAAHISKDHPARGMNLLASAAQGGSLLFSPHVQDPLLSVFPAPGEPWQLADLNLSGEPASGISGLYAPLGEDVAPASGHFLIARVKGGYSFAGSLDLLARGRVYPAEEVTALLDDVEGVLGNSTVITPEGSELNRTRVTLVVFVDPFGDHDLGTLQRTLSTRIALGLGEGAVPDLFRFFPLAPRRDAEGAIDHNWCRWQFLGGNLGRKSREAVFRTSSALRVLARRAAAPRRPAQGGP